MGRADRKAPLLSLKAISAVRSPCMISTDLLAGCGMIWPDSGSIGSSWPLWLVTRSLVVSQRQNMSWWPARSPGVRWDMVSSPGFHVSRVPNSVRSAQIPGRWQGSRDGFKSSLLISCKKRGLACSFVVSRSGAQGDGLPRSARNDVVRSVVGIVRPSRISRTCGAWRAAVSSKISLRS